METKFDHGRTRSVSYRFASREESLLKSLVEENFEAVDGVACIARYYHIAHVFYTFLRCKSINSVISPSHS